MGAYDAIVIGSGPNGLAAAIVLAKEGQKVLVIEGRHSIGGGTRTEELTLPGYYHDHCSAVHPLGVLSPFLKSLPLEKHGLTWIYPEVSVAHPLDGEPSVLLTKSVRDTATYLEEDEDAWIRIFQNLQSNGNELIEDLLKPLRFPKHPITMTRFGLKAFLPSTIFAVGKFKGARAKALFAGCAAHSTLPLDYYFTSAFGLLFGIMAHLENWPVAQGGSSSITNAMAGVFKKLGGEIQTSFWVKSLSDLPSSKAYIFDTDPKQLAEIASDELPNWYKKKLLQYKFGPGVFKVDWALDECIPWIDPNNLKASTVHLGGPIEEIRQSEQMAWDGKHCDTPFIILCQQSIFDPSRAPEGKHTGYAYCHVPNGSTKDMTVVIENQIERFAPGFRDIILKRHTSHSKDFYASNPNYYGGAISGGATYFSQLFSRPVSALKPYATPNPRIFICSASTPPGGGVHGMCGYWAAQAVLKKNK